MADWWRGCVTYQVYPRSFQDSNGDGIGDLPGITAQLEHIASLGVDAVWLSPVNPSPMADMGYDVSDYTGIDPLFGTLGDFDRLLERAHALGLKVIIDQVLSHSSDQHPWFVESRSSRNNPRADWYVWADPQADGSPPNNWLSVFGGSAWEWDTRRRQYYLHNFLASQPDLNFHELGVQEALLDVLRFWLDRGVDGFRFDTVNYYFHDRKLRPDPPEPREDPLPSINPYDMQDHIRSKTQPETVGFLKRIRTLLNQYEARTSVGEVGESRHRAIKVMAEYTKGHARLHMAYSFDLLGAEFNAHHFRSRIERFFKEAPDGWPCWSFSNHDVVRHVTRWHAHALDTDALTRQAAALLLSLQGSVCLYQGEELGMTETELEFCELTDPRGIRFWPDDRGRDGCRTPIPWDSAHAHSGFSSTTPWLPIKPPQAARHVAGQARDPASPLTFYREMLAWRSKHHALRDGATRFFKTGEPVLAFFRQSPGAAIACVFNLGPENHALRVRRLAAVPGAPSQAAAMTEERLTLGANGFAFLAPTAGAEDARLRFKR